MPAVEYTKSFTISVVIGKDVVPRIGLHQMEALRADLINAIKRSVDPKVIITIKIVALRQQFLSFSIYLMIYQSLSPLSYKEFAKTI